MTEEQWINVVSRVCSVLNYGIEKKEKIKKSKTAKLIASIPYIANCDKALETSFSHLIIYLMSQEESAKDIFFHKQEDDRDIYLRLHPISNFSGGNKDVINYCMDLLALTMLSNYKKDMDNDKLIGKYNPLNAGVWDYKFFSAKIIEKIDTMDTMDTMEINKIFSKDDALEGYW